jgi:hypothetical protein
MDVASVQPIAIGREIDQTNANEHKAGDEAT